MEQLDGFYGYFNLALGTLFTLIGFKVYRPFNKDKEAETYKKFGAFYKLGGIGLIIWGLTKIL